MRSSVLDPRHYIPFRFLAIFIGLAIAAFLAVTGTKLASATHALDPFNGAVQALEADDFAQAVDLYTAAVDAGDLEPEMLIAAYRNRGEANRKLRNFRAAVEDFDQVLALGGADSFVYFQLADAYFDLGAFEKSIENLDAAIDLDPDFVVAIGFRGSLYDRAYDWPRAIEDYDRVIALDADNARALAARGRAYLLLSDLTTALTSLNRALDLDPELSIFPAYRNRGYVNFHLGNFSDAAEDFAAAIRLDDGSIYRTLWRHISTERAGGGGVRALRSESADFDFDDWPGPVVRMFLGAVEGDEVLAEALDPDPDIERDQLTEATFYVGQYLLLQGNRDEAVPLFLRTVELDAPFFVEVQGAKYELQRLQVGNRD